MIIFKIPYQSIRCRPLKELMQFNVTTHTYEGHFFMFVESGCISTNIEFTVP